METIKKWLWQHEEYPSFNYVQSTLNTLLSKTSRNTGRLEGAIYGVFAFSEPYLRFWLLLTFGFVVGLPSSRHKHA